MDGNLRVSKPRLIQTIHTHQDSFLKTWTFEPINLHLKVRTTHNRTVRHKSSSTDLARALDRRNLSSARPIRRNVAHPGADLFPGNLFSDPIARSRPRSLMSAASDRLLSTHRWRWRRRLLIKQNPGKRAGRYLCGRWGLWAPFLRGTAFPRGGTALWPQRGEHRSVAISETDILEAPRKICGAARVDVARRPQSNPYSRPKIAGPTEASPITRRVGEVYRFGMLTDTRRYLLG